MRAALEAALNACLPGGLSFDGTVTFNCGGAATITVTSTKTISADTTIDGGSLITISGGNSVGVFSVNTGVTFTVQNLAIANGNSASGYGGGIFNGFNGNGGTLTVTNSTFSGNSAGYHGGGGGVFNQGTLTVANTIVANSTSGGNCLNYGGFTDGGHNIDDDGSCGFSGTSFSNTNPMLDPAGLVNNGGPTQTIAIEIGSLAINAGDESVCSTTTGTAPVDNLDQRGFIRPGVGAANCSIGAFEANSASPCVGDYNGDGRVTVDEILTMVNIALGNASVSACDAGDANHDGQITVYEILTAVNNALNGCG